MSSVLHLNPPPDGWNSIERAILREIIARSYRAIEDPTDRFIFMALTENDYTQEEVASMVGISQKSISKRFDRTKAYLILQRTTIGYKTGGDALPSE